MQNVDVVAYFADDPTRVYQLLQWLPVLEQLAETQSVGVVLRDPETEPIVRRRTPLPVFLAAEFPELDQPGHEVALQHKQKVRARLNELGQAAGARDADQLADQLLLLLDGAFASKRVFRSAESPAGRLSATVKMLLDLQLRAA